jgi:hypothetical protein
MCIWNLKRRPNNKIVKQQYNFCNWTSNNLTLYFRHVCKFAKNDFQLRHVCLSVSSSVLPHGIIRLSLEGFSLNFVFLYLTKIKVILYEDLCTFFIISRPFPLRTRNVSNQVVQKIRTHYLFSVTCFRKLCRFWDNMKNKNCRDRQATDDIMTHANCMLDA